MILFIHSAEQQRGQRIGLEKMVQKHGTSTSPAGRHIGMFIAEQKHPFFEGETFHSVLRGVQVQPRRFKVYEKAGTLRISVHDPAKAGQVVKNPAIASQSLASAEQPVQGVKVAFQVVMGAFTPASST